MIRKAVWTDIPAIARTYEELLTYEAEHGSNSRWQLGVYPTAAVAERRVPEGTMYVLEEAGEICASMILNHEQAPEYDTMDWLYPAAAEEVLVLHTLCIPPQKAGCGYGQKMVAYAKSLGREQGCRVMRIDTHAENEPAKKLYQKNGFRIVGYGESLLEGLIPEKQVFLECNLEA